VTSLATSRVRAAANRNTPRKGPGLKDPGQGPTRPRWYDIRSRMAYRQGIGQVLSKGPLFQPDTGSEIRGLHVMSISRQPGWIFVCTDQNFPASVRIGIAEADDTELRSLNANRRVSRDLRIRQGEVLRYSVFTNDVYSALRSVEAYLKEFRTIDERYRVHSAAAATAIETCGVYLRARRSNFEPIQPGNCDVDNDVISETPEQYASDATDSDSETDDGRDSRRGAQRIQLANVVSEVGHSIALASEALQDSASKSRLAAGSGSVGEHRGLLRPDTAAEYQNSNDQASLSASDIASMEKWVMRREAIEYMKLRRLQFAQSTVTAAFLGAACALGMFIVSDAIAQKYHLLLLVSALSVSAATLVAATFWLRYRKGLIIWRRILANCADATLPEVRPRRI